MTILYKGAILRKLKDDRIKAVIKGDRLAMRDLYQQYERMWFRLCLRYAPDRSQAEDILQEGLIYIFKDLHQFDETKSKFSTWSSRVLVNAALRFIRKNQWQQAFEDIESIPKKEPFYEDIIGQITAKELTKIIQSLPTGYRIIFNMYEIEGYTHREIAEKLEISTGTSKSQLSKAKRMLRKKIELLF